MIALCATLCGADGCFDMEEFGKSKERFLREFLSLPHGVPAHDAFSRIFRALDPARFAAGRRAFVQRFAEAHHGVVAVDGKTLHHSFDRAAAASALHMVSVNGGGIMLHAERPDGLVAAAQKCAIHGPLSVATRGGGCTAWSSMRRFDWRLSTRV